MEVYELVVQSPDGPVKEQLRDLALKTVTKQKEVEINDTQSARKCLYCYDHVTGGVHKLIEHINTKHIFRLGDPNNIVYCSALLDHMESKLHNHECIYCEKTFDSVEILRKHMRKKEHRTINPHNKFYDKFYLINYKKPGTPWYILQNENRDFDSQEQEAGPDSTMDDMWRDWVDESEVPVFMCLFCMCERRDIAELRTHILKLHNCDIASVLKDFNHYDRIKAINFLRSKVMVNECPYCDSNFSSHTDLQRHLKLEQHCRLPTPSMWCTETYLKPVLQKTDNLLCNIENLVESEGTYFHCPSVISEEVSYIHSEDEVRRVVADEESRQRESSVSKCLFCKRYYVGDTSASCIIEHMHTYHSFDWYAVMGNLPVEQSKLMVQYIRQTSKAMQCHACQQQFKNEKDLDEHKSYEGHNGRPEDILYLAPEVRHELQKQIQETDCLIRKIVRDAHLSYCH